MRTLTYDEWLKLGKRLYGKDIRRWKFRCPACGNVQSDHSVKRRNPSLGDTSSWIFFACEGRHTDGVGCNWTLGGLLQIHRLEVVDERGIKPHRVRVFEFADDPEASHNLAQSSAEASAP